MILSEISSVFTTNGIELRYVSSSRELRIPSMTALVVAPFKERRAIFAFDSLSFESAIRERMETNNSKRGFVISILLSIFAFTP